MSVARPIYRGPEIAHVIRTSNHRPHADMLYRTVHLFFIHETIKQGTSDNIPVASTVALSFDYIRSFSGSDISRTKRVINAFPYMAPPRQTARSRALLVPVLTHYRREDAAKLRNISELLTFGAKFFWRSVNFGALGEK